MEKKKCPYCGEEILDTAKKCKHCKEWLEENENEFNNPNKHKKHNTIKEFGIFLSWLFVIALIIKFVLIIVHPTLE